jgi:S-(hydroxymethyl)glutathione synthase
MDLKFCRLLVLDWSGLLLRFQSACSPDGFSQHLFSNTLKGLIPSKVLLVILLSIVIDAPLFIEYYAPLKTRLNMAPSLHPLIDNGITKGIATFSGGKLHCLCPSNKVEVTLASNVLHNHACGCSQCWKPAGALFAVIAVIPVDKVKVTANADKLKVLDESATIRRHACKECGAHLYGRIEKDHAFKGLDFVHVELSDEKGWQEPQFAGFVSSIIEQRFDPSEMESVRSNFHSIGLETYDVLSPALMDALSTFAAQK